MSEQEDGRLYSKGRYYTEHHSKEELVEAIEWADSAWPFNRISDVPEALEAMVEGYLESCIEYWCEEPQREASCCLFAAAYIREFLDDRRTRESDGGMNIDANMALNETPSHIYDEIEDMKKEFKEVYGHEYDKKQDEDE